MPHILAVLPDHPFPLDMGNRVRNLRILEALSRDFRLTIVTLVHDPNLLGNPGPVQDLGRWVPVLASHRCGRRAWLSWHLRARWSAAWEGIRGETFFLSLPVLSRTVARLVGEERPDLVHAAYWSTLRHLRGFPRPPLWVVDTHDVQFERQERLFGRVSPREREQELQQLARYDRIIAITEKDRQTFAAHLPASVPCEVIGMGLDLEQWRPGTVPRAQGKAPRVAFYGNLSTEANQAGALHLLRDLTPTLSKRIPGLEVLILGAGPPPSIRSFDVPGRVRVPGYVEDVRPWLASTRVLALALRTGSGQRGRVVEALAMGVPVVGYAEALEGLELSEGEGIVSVRTPEAFIEALVRLLEHPEAARNLGASGRAAVEQRYGWEATYGRFPLLYRRLLNESSGNE